MLKKWISGLALFAVLFTLPACGRKNIAGVGDPIGQTIPTESTGAKTTLPADDTGTTSGETTSVETAPAQQETTQPALPPTESTQSLPTEPPAPTPTLTPETETVPIEQTQPEQTEPAPTEPTYTLPEPEYTYGHTALSPGEYYQYSRLPAKEKQLYSALVNAIEGLKSKLPVNGISIKADDALNLFQKVLADNPEYFWVSRQCVVIYDSRTEYVEAFVLQYTDGEVSDQVGANNQPVVRADRTKIAAMRESLEEKILQILSVVPANIPEVDREKRIHDYIIANVSYDMEAAEEYVPVDHMLPKAFNIYGAAVEGKAVCEGYAKLFQYLCYRTGINATQIPGVAAGGGHMWNAVKLDGDWYEIDVTWNDGVTGVPYYGYFNLTNSQMGQNHTADTSRMSQPAATGTKYRYADYFALKLVSKTALSDNYTAVMDSLLTEGSGYLIIYKNGITITGGDLNTLVYNSTSVIQQYAHSRGYRLELVRSYSTYEDFIYISYTANRL